VQWNHVDANWLENAAIGAFTIHFVPSIKEEGNTGKSVDANTWRSASLAPASMYWYRASLTLREIIASE
jgi:hypothetical protein